MSLGADGLEFDVHLSRDEHAVVIHDATLDRTTEAEGPVARHTAAELAGIDAGYRFERSGRHPFRGRGIGIPRLRDVLARYPDIPLIIELKGSNPDLARVAVREVRSAGALRRVCFGSFEDVTIEAARHCGADVVTSGASGEIRRTLRTAFLGLAPRRPGFRALQVPERHGMRRIATKRFIRARQPRRHPGSRLDGERRRGHGAPADVGRARDHHRSARHRGAHRAGVQHGHAGHRMTFAARHE